MRPMLFAAPEPSRIGTGTASPTQGGRSCSKPSLISCCRAVPMPKRRRRPGRGLHPRSRLELGQKLPLAAVPHGDGNVAQQSTAFCSLYRGTSKLSVEFLRSQAGEPCERRIHEFRPGVGRMQLSGWRLLSDSTGTPPGRCRSRRPGGRWARAALPEWGRASRW